MRIQWFMIHCICIISVILSEFPEKKSSSGENGRAWSTTQKLRNYSEAKFNRNHIIFVILSDRSDFFHSGNCKYIHRNPLNIGSLLLIDLNSIATDQFQFFSCNDNTYQYSTYNHYNQNSSKKYQIKEKFV
jgi:hypothetical protein